MCGIYGYIDTTGIENKDYNDVDSTISLMNHRGPDSRGIFIDQDYSIAFGHVRLDELNPGKWFAKKLAERLNANKVLVQKSGYFGRSAKANSEDLELIFKVVDKAVESAINGENGVVGWDEENNNKLCCIDFSRIKGGKPFNTELDWYIKMKKEIYNI